MRRDAGNAVSSSITRNSRDAILEMLARMLCAGHGSELIHVHLRVQRCRQLGDGASAVALDDASGAEKYRASICRDDRDMNQHYLRKVAKALGFYWPGCGWDVRFVARREDFFFSWSVAKRHAVHGVDVDPHVELGH
jgi:hypothetical protein